MSEARRQPLFRDCYLPTHMFGIGMTEMVVIALIALVVLGPKRLPELARTLGRTLAEFRRSATDLRREFADVMDETRIEPPTRLPAPPAPESRSESTEPAAVAAPPAQAAAPGEPDAGATPPGGASGG